MVFITETGAGSVELDTMRVVHQPCEGLNGSAIVAVAFDPTLSTKVGPARGALL